MYYEYTAPELIYMNIYQLEKLRKFYNLFIFNNK